MDDNKNYDNEDVNTQKTEDEGYNTYNYSDENFENSRNIIEEDNKIKSSSNKKKNYSRIFFSLYSVVLVVVFLTAYNYLFVEPKINELKKENKVSTTALNTNLDSKNTNSATTVESIVAKNVIPSIVGVRTIVQGDTQSSLYDFPGMARYAEDVGSGVIVDKKGYILTNSHVIANGKGSRISVLLSDGKESTAKLVWNDMVLDLAILKIEPSNELKAVKFADSDKIVVGDKAIAIGNPLGLELQSTLTSGYISGKNRSIQLEGGAIMDGLLQTDAAINSGNSGGALLNAQGQLIGINTAKPKLADGIGFAIPSNIAKKIVDRVITTGDFKPTLIGISGVNVETFRNRLYLDESVQKGVYIFDVYADSPAAKASLQSGDVITAIDGKSIDSMNALKTELLNYKIGDSAELTIIRDKKTIKVKITFNEFKTSSVNEHSNLQPRKQSLPIAP